MNPILAEYVLLQFYKDGDYYDFACITDCSIETTTEVKDVRTIGNGVWKKKRGQSLAYIVNCSGLIELEGLQPVSFWLLNFQHQILHVQWRMLFEQPETSLVKILTGEALIENSVFAAAATGFATSDFRMQGHGAYTVADSATVCEATIGSISFTAGDDPGEIIIHYEGVLVFDGGRLEYTVDGGGRVAIFDSGTSGDFTITGLAEGDHTVVVYAVCSTGIDGESNEITFHVDEGGDPGVGCNTPGDIAYGEITSTSAEVTWGAASPVPDDGYYWELVNTVTSEVVQSDYTSLTTVNLTGLSNGVLYLFRVRSICELGVSQSAFRSDFFTAEDPPSCNVPGTPVMSAITSTTATATWTAPSPVPGDGYHWEVLQGVTLIDSGDTSSLSVGLTGLSAGTTYTFRVKAVCETGVSESGYNSTSFDTTGSSSIDWAFVEDGANGTLTIKKNGITVVSATSTTFGNFTAEGGDTIQITAVTGGSENSNIMVDDITASSQIINSDDTGTHIESFVVTTAHDYSITVTITAI